MKAEFLQQDESAIASKKANNLATKQLVLMAITQALIFTPKETGEYPIADFDMKYFTEVMLNLFNEKNHKNIQAILNGEDLRWWND